MIRTSADKQQWWKMNTPFYKLCNGFAHVTFKYQGIIICVYVCVLWGEGETGDRSIERIDKSDWRPKLRDRFRVVYLVVEGQ